MKLRCTKIVAFKTLDILFLGHPVYAQNVTDVGAGDREHKFVSPAISPRQLPASFHFQFILHRTKRSIESDPISEGQDRSDTAILRYRC